MHNEENDEQRGYIDIGRLFGINPRARRVGDVTEDASKKLAAAAAIEVGIEYRALAARAHEFDQVLDEACTLEQATAGWVRHQIAEQVAVLGAKYTLDTDERVEFKARVLDHQAAAMRWFSKMTRVVELVARLNQAAAGNRLEATQ